MPTIRESHEEARGCGFRQPGGFYLVTSMDKLRHCGKMPLPLHVCPTCHQGIKPARGWTWVDAFALFKSVECKGDPNEDCSTCRLSYAALKADPQMGLLWIGQKFYATPQDFMVEALTMGISRRIARVPKDFKVGAHWVLLAHRQTVPDPEAEGGFRPGIFFVFRPTALEYVVTGKETDEELEALEQRGFTLVKVIRVNKQLKLGGD